MSVSQPTVGSLEQCAQPAAHDVAGTEQTPALQVVAPLTCGKALQSLPHVPQFFASVCVFVHAPLQ
jgi:hypothetical protein